MPYTPAKTFPLIAAIDLGSNSFHMVLAKADHGEIRILERLGEKVQLAAGIGWDRYTGDAEVQLREGPDPVIEIGLKETRTLAFINAGLDLAAVSLVAEAGYQSGREEELSTDFADYDTSDGKFFAGLGLRLGF